MKLRASAVACSGLSAGHRGSSPGLRALHDVPAHQGRLHKHNSPWPSADTVICKQTLDFEAFAPGLNCLRLAASRALSLICLSGSQPCCTVQDPPYDAGSFAKIVTRDASKEGGSAPACASNVREVSACRAILLSPWLQHCLHSCGGPGGLGTDLISWLSVFVANGDTC